MTVKIRSAVIAAGGKGTRLAMLSPSTPKALSIVFDKPIILDQIDKFLEQGINDFVLLLGYKSVLIEAAVKKHLANKSGVTVTFLVEDKPLGSGGALLWFKNKLPKIFFFVYCDVFFDINLSSFTDNFFKLGSDLHLVVHPNDHPYDSDLVTLDANLTVKAIKPHPHTNDDFSGNNVNAAFYIIKREILPEFDGEKLDFAQDVMPKILASEAQVFGYKTAEFLKDMGTPQRLQKVRLNYKNRYRKSSSAPVIFIDRDGTINNIETGKYITDRSELELCDGAAAAIKRIRDKGYFCVCVTNQPVIARGDITVDQLNMIHQHLEYLLGLEGAYLDLIVYCPHHPDAGYLGEIKSLKINCDCRKPASGMFKMSSDYIKPDLKSSWMIGDSVVDVEAGLSFGVRTAYISDEVYPDRNVLNVRPPADLVVNSLEDFSLQLPSIPST